ncbi:hypothetical protein HMI56_003684 [Coelomomyces lativittatus]|nr:hypothetical protein HMI56_003684 [Coelomomyces lativittatus]
MAFVPLGTGTFGRVHLAKWIGSSKYFAIKVLEKAVVVRLKQVEHIQSERDILMTISHPFIVSLYTTFQTKDHLYFLLEYACGGELFSHLRRAGRFTQDVTRFYSAEITSALEYLHEQHIIYRDLKPENLLLDEMGHIKLTDFGFSKVVHDRTWTLCGTPEYLAPEIIQGHGHAFAVDWWALGILIYEMLAGYPPFYDDTPYGIYEKILSGTINFPLLLDYRAIDLISKLLRVDRSQRLGNLKNGAADVKAHEWFKGVNWTHIVERQVQPPIIPVIRGPEDTGYFEIYDEPPPFEPTATSDDQYSVLFTDF